MTVNRMAVYVEQGSPWSLEELESLVSAMQSRGYTAKFQADENRGAHMVLGVEFSEPSEYMRDLNEAAKRVGAKITQTRWFGEQV